MPNPRPNPRSNPRSNPGLRLWGMILLLPWGYGYGRVVWPNMGITHGQMTIHGYNAWSCMGNPMDDTPPRIGGMGKDRQMHVRYMSDACQMHVRCMSGACQVHARCTPGACQMNVRCMSDACPMTHPAQPNMAHTRQLCMGSHVAIYGYTPWSDAHIRV